MAKPEEFVAILAGGGGTRLWPASRRSRPKQLLSLGADESLLASTFRRLSALVGAERTLIVTAADQALAIRQALPALPAANLVVEPRRRPNRSTRKPPSIGRPQAASGGWAPVCPDVPMVE